MKSISVPEINFSNQEIIKKEYTIVNSIDIKSSKNLAYVVRWQLARKRSGSAKTKSMDEISGTTAKPYKQKGTGRARQGSKRSVQFVGGRTCHGPMPRSFDFSIPKKIAKLAIADAIKSKIINNKIITFDPEININKTSLVSKTLNKNKIISALFITNVGKNLTQFARNIKNIKIIESKAINASDLINFEHIIVDKVTFENKIMGALK
ncbi:MAG: 50S ribosomal protein L4 [Proteobacteria bacterium]|nr:50S ribosomal protein L4 [Pseudomonadota bacterium]NCA27755.1 50S ribosomal protein L4 [Pseudomonadota bacterium]